MLVLVNGDEASFLAEQICECEDRVTFRAGTSETDTACEGVALGTTLVSDGASFAGGALVDGVLEEPPLSLQFGTKQRQVQARWLMTESIGLLLASSRAIALLRCGQSDSTHQAGRRRNRRV
jgi:hypothetical protein